MTQSNNFRKIFFVLILFSFFITSFADISNDNLSIFTSENSIVIKGIEVKTQSLKDIIAEDFEFFVLMKKADDKENSILKTNYKLEEIDNTIKMTTFSDNINMEMFFKLSENNMINIDYTVTSKVKDLNLGKYMFILKPGLKEFTKYGRSIYYRNNQEVDSLKLKNNSKSEPLNSADWVGFVNQYYTIAFKNNRFSQIIVGNIEEKKEDEEKNYQLIKAFLPEKILGKGSSLSIDFKGYIGEKDLTKLQNAGMEEILDLGFFGGISKYFLIALKKLNVFAKNWGISIMLLTLIIKLILYPLNISQAKSMANMQKLNPEITKIKEKYKNDSQKMNVEIMELYKKHGVNPFGGCFPILIQLPILFALFTMLRTSIELKGATMLWLTDLAKPDPLYIMPVLIAVSMYYQQKSMSAANANPQQQQMMVMMPFIMLVITVSLPSGVLLYWLVSNVLSFIQQIYVNKHIYGGDVKK